MPSQTRTDSARTCSCAAGENDRTVASNVASSGMTLCAVPAWKAPIVMTTGSKTSNRRVTNVCRAVTISHAAGIGSFARCGEEPWPPEPRTVTRRTSAADMTGPGRVANRPAGSIPDVTWSARAASTRRPAASSTPSSTMCRAPS